MQHSTVDWSGYPMGPKLRIWLGININNDAKNDRRRPEESERQGFADFLLQSIGMSQTQPNLDEGQLVDLADELVAMDLPLVALKLIDSFSNCWHRNHFRGVLAEGIAAMQVEDLERSEMCFRVSRS